MGERPTHKVVAKSKASGEFYELMAFWTNERGISGYIDTEKVASITLTNGATLKTGPGGNCWLNLQVQKDEQNQERSPAQQDEEQNQEAPDW